MTRAVRTVIGLVLIAISALAICWAIYNLVRIGTCASGGPYVIAQICPPGTGTKIFALIGGIFGILIGAAVSPLRGSAGVAWGLGFMLIGLGALVAAVGPAHPPGGDGLTIFGWAFGGFMVLLGVVGLFGGLLLSRGVEVAQAKFVEMARPAGVSFSSTPVVSVEGGPLTPEQAASPAAPGSPPVTPAEDLTDELAQLAQLHSSGALTDAEFQKAKDRLLGS